GQAADVVVRRGGTHNHLWKLAVAAGGIDSPQPRKENRKANARGGLDAWKALQENRVFSGRQRPSASDYRKRRAMEFTAAGLRLYPL
ncbi:MAG: hypothetical protein U1E05_19240, partial [Patescibacteria group bacterium]|nr:hypothetical protein [Patescibacteria group bacterium]